MTVQLITLAQALSPRGITGPGNTTARSGVLYMLDKPPHTLFRWDGLSKSLVAIDSLGSFSSLAGLNAAHRPGLYPSGTKAYVSSVGTVEIRNGAWVPLGPVNATKDRHKAVHSRGTLVFDWRIGTYADSGAGAYIAATSYSPDGAAVAEVQGDGATGANYSSLALAANVGTVGVDSVGVWVRIPPRSNALKGYRAAPVKMILAPLAGFTNSLTLTFVAVADGRWHFYNLDPYATAPAGTFVWGDAANGLVGQVRVRTSIDAGTNASAEKGHAPLQAGEVVQFGGIRFGARSKAYAMIRFDDGLASLLTVKQATLAAPYVGQSGVTVPAGSYSAFDLVSAFGFTASAFILTRHVDTTAVFESSAGLRQLQDAGWEIGFQTHDNPRSNQNHGVRLLGPSGCPMVEASRSMSWVASTGVFTNTGNNLVDSTSPGQGNPVTLIGAPPAPFTAGPVYWIRALSQTTFALFSNEADSLANTNRILPGADGAGTFGWNWRGATTDSSAILADFQQGRQAMAAMGFKGLDLWAPNQGAYDWRVEDAFVATGMRGWFATHQFVRRSALGMSSMFAAAIGINEANGYLPPFATLMTGYQTDGGAASEANARAYVQNLCATGTIGQNYHHGFVPSNTLVFCAYLDELKLRQDRGELEVVLPSRVCDVIENLSMDPG